MATAAAALTRAATRQAAESSMECLVSAVQPIAVVPSPTSGRLQSRTRCATGRLVEAQLDDLPAAP
jgi:hypothetical protein